MKGPESGPAIDLAELLDETGRGAAAIAQARTAVSVLEPLGATFDARPARSLLLALEGSTTRPDSARRAARGPLTRRQREVLALVAEGRAGPEIATRLHLSEHTVHRHVANILTSLGVTSRLAAVARALRDGLL